MDVYAKTTAIKHADESHTSGYRYLKLPLRLVLLLNCHKLRLVPVVNIFKKCC